MVGIGANVDNILRSPVVRPLVSVTGSATAHRDVHRTGITACANCRIVLEEGLEHYQMDIPVVGLTEMIAEHIPEKGA